MEFEWDDANADHIGVHGVEPSEAEEVLSNDPVEITPETPHVTPHGTELRWAMVGVTDAGRYLSVIFTIRSEKVRVVTAFPASPKRQALFDKHRKL